MLAVISAVQVLWHRCMEAIVFLSRTERNVFVVTSIFYLSTNYISKKIKITKGDSVSYVGSLLKIPTTFGDHAVEMDYLVVEKYLFGLIIGLLTLSGMRANLDLGTQSFCLYIGSEEVVITL